MTTERIGTTRTSPAFAAPRLAPRGAIARAFALTIALAIVLVTALGGTASASIAGLQLVSGSSASSSSNKSATVPCPTGKRVVGAGGELAGGGGEVVLGLVRPNATLTSVTAQGREDENGTASDWSVRAFAICAPPLPGLERVSAQSPSNSANKAVTASCPAGKRLLGTGAEIDGGGGQVAPNDVIPGSALKGATVQGLEDENGTGVNWRALAYAVCANPVAGLERAAAVSPTDSSDKSAFAACPAGKQLTGVGGELGGGGGEVVLNGLTPQGGLQDMLVSGFEDEDGTSANWFTRAFAICAAASERVVGGSATDSVSPKSATAFCPAGKQVTGAGAEIDGGGGEVVLDDLIPLPGQSVFVTGFEDETGFASNWFLRAYAICATPLPGLEVVSNSSPTDSSFSKAVTATCPAGKQVVGAGGGLFNGDGQVVLDAAVPFSDLSAVAAIGIEDESGYADNWSVTAHAVCANPPPGLELVTARTDPDSDFFASVAATCPSGKNLLGMGADIDANGEVVLDDVRPNAALTNATVTAFEDEDGLASDWSLTARAICANP
jgi:hypothetical protein